MFNLPPSLGLSLEQLGPIPQRGLAGWADGGPVETTVSGTLSRQPFVPAPAAAAEQFNHADLWTSFAQWAPPVDTNDIYDWY